MSDFLNPVLQSGGTAQGRKNTVGQTTATDGQAPGKTRKQFADTYDSTQKNGDQGNGAGSANEKSTNEVVKDNSVSDIDDTRDPQTNEAATKPDDIKNNDRLGTREGLLARGETVVSGQKEQTPAFATDAAMQTDPNFEPAGTTVNGTDKAKLILQDSSQVVTQTTLPLRSLTESAIDRTVAGTTDAEQSAPRLGPVAQDPKLPGQITAEKPKHEVHLAGNTSSRNGNGIGMAVEGELAKQGIVGSEKTAAAEAARNTILVQQTPSNLAQSGNMQTLQQPKQRPGTEEIDIKKQDRFFDDDLLATPPREAPKAATPQTATLAAAANPANSGSSLAPTNAEYVLRTTAETEKLQLDGELETLRTELGATSSTNSILSSSSPTSLLNRADLPKSIAVQIQEYARALGDKPIDVALNPEELGRVRLSISTTEGAVTLQIMAERPETLEIMKRHADLLAREFASLGFSSIDLSFGQGNSAEGDQENADGDTGSGSGNAPALELEHDIDPQNLQAQGQQTISGSTGLDIRI